MPARRRFLRAYGANDDLPLRPRAPRQDDGIIAIDLFEPEMGPLIQQSSGKQAIPAYPGRAIEAIHAKLQQSGTYLLRVTHSTGGDVPYRLVIQRFLDQTP